MGDFTGILTGLNLSPINTILLAVLLFVLKSFNDRLGRLEGLVSKNSKSIAFIKGRLDLEEEE